MSYQLVIVYKNKREEILRIKFNYDDRLHMDQEYNKFKTSGKLYGFDILTIDRYQIKKTIKKKRIKE